MRRTAGKKDTIGTRPRESRAERADAQRNIGALLAAAKTVFEKSGVDAPVREIAIKAGVGVGTVYRHFPRRSDLIAAVSRQEIDACADVALTLATKYEPIEALTRWMQRYVDLIAAKRGLAAVLHSGDPAYTPLPAYFDERLRPALSRLLGAAIAAGKVRADVDADDLLRAVASLAMSSGDEAVASARRMVALLVDGLRYGATPPASRKREA